MENFKTFDNMFNTALSKKEVSTKVQEKPTSVTTATVSTPVDLSVKDEFVAQKKKNGLFEKFFNKVKNWTGLGTGSKKVEQKIAEYEAGKITKQEVDNEIEKYKKSQKNAEQTFGDVVTSGVTLSTFFKGKNMLAKMRASKEIGALNPILKEFIEFCKLSGKNSFINFAKGIFKSNVKALAVAIPVLALFGGYVKTAVLSLNRIGSKEFSVDKELKKTDKKKYKEECKKASKASWKEFFRNFATGAVNGIITPITALGGAIIGAPVYLAGMLGLKYAASGDKNKSFDGFVNNFKDNYVVNTIGAAAIGTMALRKGRFSSTLQKNLNTVVENLRNAKLKTPEYLSDKTNYNQIKDLLLGSPAIKNIINDSALTVEEKIQKLTETNFFSVKFLQTSGANNDLVKTLIENCPPSRTLEEAQTVINQMMGSAKYKVEKLLGTGTVAETYLAKDASGKEVCVKILKKGIDAQKIEQDKKAFINLITQGKPSNELTKEQDYLVRCIEDYASGISKEVDLENEMKAAQALAKVTKKANVVVPIEAKPGVYVMEKAKGISVETMRDYYITKNAINALKKMAEKGEKSEWFNPQEEITRLEQKLEQIKAKAPEFKDFDLDNSDIKKILLKYIDLQTEQFSKIYRGGKPIHADIHPGNVIINLDAIKGNSKEKLFTLIDTGNVINVTKQQSLDMLKFMNWVHEGNVKDLARSVLEDSILPSNLTKEKAVELMETELKKCFFDNSTALETMSIDNFFKLTDSIQRKYNIINNNTQLNLNKAKKASATSFQQLMETLFEKKYGDLNPGELSKGEKNILIAKVTADMASIGKKLLLATKIQEFLNLFKQSPKEIAKSLFNKNRPKTNSVDYLTFKFKQNMKATTKDIANDIAP